MDHYSKAPNDQGMILEAVESGNDPNMKLSRWLEKFSTRALNRVVLTASVIIERRLAEKERNKS